MDIEKIITDEFYNMLKNGNTKQEEIQKRITEIKKEFIHIKEKGQLEVVTALYILKRELSHNNIKVEFSKVFEKCPIISKLIVLGDKEKGYCSITNLNRTSNKIYDTLNILTIPQELKGKVVTILGNNCKNWKDIIKINAI